MTRQQLRVYEQGLKPLMLFWETTFLVCQGAVQSITLSQMQHLPVAYRAEPSSTDCWNPDTEIADKTLRPVQCTA